MGLVCASGQPERTANGSITSFKSTLEIMSRLEHWRHGYLDVCSRIVVGFGGP